MRGVARGKTSSRGTVIPETTPVRAAICRRVFAISAYTAANTSKNRKANMTRNLSREPAPPSRLPTTPIRSALPTRWRPSTSSQAVEFTKGDWVAGENSEPVDKTASSSLACLF